MLFLFFLNTSSITGGEPTGNDDRKEAAAEEKAETGSVEAERG